MGGQSGRARLSGRVATALTALSFAPWWYFLFRFATGFGLGG